jgi:hypothetical protein
MRRPVLRLIALARAAWARPTAYDVFTAILSVGLLASGVWVGAAAVAVLCLALRPVLLRGGR